MADGNGSSLWAACPDPALCEAADGDNVGVAFGLTVGAGMATTLGSLLPFLPCVRRENSAVLAVALAVSCGVMLYVSFVEILPKSLHYFCCVTEKHYSLAATGCFFAGILLSMLLHAVVRAVQTRSLFRRWRRPARAGSKPRPEGAASASREQPPDPERDCDAPTGAPERADEGAGVELIEVREEPAEGPAPEASQAGLLGCPEAAAPGTSSGSLTEMSLFTGIAIFLHNFPEGLATFVAALADTSLGLSLAIAIAIHNIPEGIAVSLPVYYATGSKCKAFWWSFASGISEPLGALLGWLVLKDIIGAATYAVIFGLVAGMMVLVCLRKLLPVAHQLDPSDRRVTSSLIAGMAIMALSLVLFTY